MMRWQLLAWSALLCACIVFWVSVVGCVVGCAVPAATMLDDLRSQAVDPRDPAPMVWMAALADAEMAAGQPASVRIVHAPQIADVAGGLPWVVCHDRPVTGSVWRCDWLTQYVASYPDGIGGDMVRPDRAVALLVTLRPPPPPQPIPGGAGGMLQVPPDFVLVPDRLESLPADMRPDRVFDFVQDASGRIVLYVRWPLAWDGLRVSAQLLVADDRVASGCVPTSMVDLHIGDG
jgi:hypothetical protein